MIKVTIKSDVEVNISIDENNKVSNALEVLREKGLVSTYNNLIFSTRLLRLIDVNQTFHEAGILNGDILCVNYSLN